MGHEAVAQTTVRPNLTLVARSVTVAPSGTVNLQWFAQNQGSKLAPSTTVRLQEVAADGRSTTFASIYVRSLRPGEWVLVASTAGVGTLSAGRRVTVRATIDPSGLILETDERDNQATQTFLYGVDFNVQLLEPSFIDAGRRVMLRAKIKNRGTLIAGLNVAKVRWVRVNRHNLDVNDDGLVNQADSEAIISYLDGFPSKPAPKDGPPFPDTTGDGNVAPVDILAVVNYMNSGATDRPGEVMLSDARTQTTAPGKEYDYTFDYLRPDPLSTTPFRFGVIVDPDERVPELDEQNNRALARVTPPTPIADIIVAGVLESLATPTGTGGPGIFEATMTFRPILANRGLLPAGASLTRIDLKWGNQQSAGGGGETTAFLEQPAIPAGATVSQEQAPKFEWKIPYNAANYPVVIKVSADCRSVVPEPNDPPQTSVPDNNVLTKTINLPADTYRADLAINQFSYVYQNGSIKIIREVTNLGRYASGGYKTLMTTKFADGNSFTEGGDYVDYRYFYPGETRDLSTYIHLNDYMRRQDDFTLTLEIKNYDDATDTNLSNNRREIKVPIPRSERRPPNLAVRPKDVKLECSSPNVTLPDQIRLVCMVQNTGDIKTDRFSVRYRMNGIDREETLANQEGLVPAEEREVTATFPFPVRQYAGKEFSVEFALLPNGEDGQTYDNTSETPRYPVSTFLSEKDRVPNLVAKSVLATCNPDLTQIRLIPVIENTGLEQSGGAYMQFTVRVLHANGTTEEFKNMGWCPSVYPGQTIGSLPGPMVNIPQNFDFTVTTKSDDVSMEVTYQIDPAGYIREVSKTDNTYTTKIQLPELKQQYAAANSGPR